MTHSLTGQCQCGAVRYRVTGTPLTLFACHCTECQRQSSSAFGLSLWVKNAEVVLEKGAMKEWVRDLPSGKKMACRFCPDCGTRLFHQGLGQNEIISLKPGTLDDTQGLQLAGHIWTGSKQAWVQLDDQLPQYPGNPEVFETLIAAWQAASPDLAQRRRPPAPPASVGHRHAEINGNLNNQK
ncbi:GFA family protein [Azohydromonas caseinilytica]|uniref:GFA family protein n=1 Tax=Azohydromonas caseinilytica TaxID=2728836 RepID=A0A848FBF7_9BURK|nr:GFA family protein [Azohydromonas caseinilytica]NML15779.1 GFA family protein [Azohydromonas caseinilytica]